MTPLRILVVMMSVLLLSGCWWQSEDDTLQGYVEGDFLDVGAEETARLVSLEVSRGDSVGSGAVLFQLDSTDAEAARTEAVARLAQAKAHLADLKIGKRQEEIDVLQANRDEIIASLKTARRDFQRYTTLHEASIVSDARTDTAEERFQILQSRLEAMEAQIEVARLAARPDAVVAAEDAVDAAGAAVARIDARIARLSGEALLAGGIQDTYFEPGEVVPAGRPVVSVLPPENLKVRFFVPEALLSTIQIGSPIRIACDGCGSGIPGSGIAGAVTFVSDSAEFTPPVIYSVKARQKLVYMVEARPAAVSGLKVGQPVDVSLGP